MALIMTRRMMLGVILVLATTVCARATDDIDELKRTVHALRRRVAELEKKVAELEPLRQAYEQEQRDQEETEELGGTPGSIASSGKPVSVRTKLRVGQVLQANDGHGWYAARVLHLKPDGQVRIHYIGWTSHFDEDVPRSRLQLDPEAISKARESVREANLEFGLREPSGLEVSEQTELRPGQHLLVEWGGQWWAGGVLELRPDGKVKVHYIGWDSTWDELVPRSRLQLESEPNTANNE